MSALRRPSVKTGMRGVVGLVAAAVAGLVGVAGLAGPAAASGGGVQKIESSLKASNHATFKATYTSRTDGRTETLVIEQAPHKQLFSVNGAVVLTTGGKTYYCSTETGAKTCVSLSGTANPMASLVELFSPAELEDALQAGYGSHLTNATYAGQPSKCVTEKSGGRAEKVCVTDKGIVAAVDGSGESFILTAYSPHVSSSSFALPSGATTETLPGGLTIPT